MNKSHGFQTVHSRHEDIDNQQIEFAGFEYLQALKTVAGNHDLMAIPFQQKPHDGLNGDVIVDHQDIGQHIFLWVMRGAFISVLQTLCCFGLSCKQVILCPVSIEFSRFWHPSSPIFSKKGQPNSG